MPVYTGFSTVACFANLGLPGLCGFIGEVMVLLGSFQAAKPGGGSFYGKLPAAFVYPFKGSGAFILRPR